MALSGNFTGATLAYSTANLSGYTGDTVLLRRSSDNATSGFTEAELRDGTALSWIGANNAFVVTIYGQDGAFDLTQSTAGSQTQIASSGAWIVTQNGLPGIRFNGTGNYTAADGNYSLTDAIYTIQVVETDNTTNNMHLFHHNLGTGSQRSWLTYYNSGNFITNLSTDGTNGASSQNTATFGAFTHSTVYIREDQIDASEATATNTIKMWLNGSSVSQTAFSGTAASSSLHDSTTSIRLGGLDSSFFYLGDWFLSVAFPDNKVADRATIYEEVRSKYFDTQIESQQVATPPPTASTPTIALTYNITPEQVATPPPTATVPTIDTFTNTDLVSENVATPPPTATIPTITTAGGQQVIAYGEFISDLGREWRVEIYDGEAAVAYPETDTLRLRSDGFQLSYESPNDDIHEVIKASKMTATIVVEPTDTAIISMVTDIAQSEEGRFYMILKEWDGDSWEWYWWGQVVTDNIKEPDKWPSQIELTAIDGLGLLANVNYNPLEGGLFTGLATFGELIAKLIYRVKQGAEMRGTDNFIKLATNWYNAAMPDTNRDPMTYTAIRQEAFWQEEDREGQTTFRPSKGNDVADAIFFGWNARIMLAKGYYHVEQVPLYGSDVILRTIVDKDGAYVSRTGETVEKEIDQVNIVSTHGGYREWARPLKAATRVHLHKGSDNILAPSSDHYATPVTFPPGSQALTTNVAGEAKRLRIRFFIKANITNTTAAQFNMARYIGMTAKVRLFDGASNSAYLTKATVQEQMSWTTNPNSRYGFLMGPFPYLAAGEQATVQTYIDFETPDFTGDDFDASTFSLEWGEDTALGAYGRFYNTVSPAPVNVSGTETVNELAWGVDPYDAAYNDSIVLQYKCVTAQIIFNDGSSNEKEYEAVNSTSTSTLEYEYPVPIPFGDIVNHKVEPGAFRIWNGSAYVTNQNGWGIGGPIDSGTHNKAFHDIAVQQAAAIRHIPRDRQYFDIYGIIDPVNCLAYDGGRYAFIGGTFVARADRWTGFWQYVGVDTTSIVINGEPILIEPTFGYTNVSAAQNFVNAVLNGLPIAISTASLDPGAITSIPILAPGHTGIKDDMTIIVTDPTVPISTKFIVSGDVADNATSITVDSLTIEQQIGAGSYITIDPVSTASAIGAIYDGTFIGSLEYWQESQSTSSPNDTVHASKFTPIASSTNADVVIQPKGTGAILAQLPDGTATGGNKRGANAVDLQMVRGTNDKVGSGANSFIGGGGSNKASGSNSVVVGGNTNLASNDYTTVGGGLNNTASGTDATVSGGNGNTASGSGAAIGGGLVNDATADYATIAGGTYNDTTGTASTVGGGGYNAASQQYATIPGGFGAVANKYGMYAYGSSNFSAYGDNQLEVYSLGRSTTDATASILTANNSTPVSSNTIAIAIGAAYVFDVMVVGTESATGKIITDHSSGYIKNVSGTTSGDTLGIFSTTDFSTAGISYNINDTDDRLDIEVTGEASTTIKWGAIVTMRKVK